MTDRPSYRVEQGITIWKRRGGVDHSLVTRYPFDDMNPGDSFFVPAINGSANSVAAATSEYRRVWPEKTFETRRTPEDPIHKMPGTRVWRTA